MQQISKTPSRNTNKKLVCGVGHNDVDYQTQVYERQADGSFKMVWKCPIYNIWNAMINRCYNKAKHVDAPTYKGCSVHEDWHSFSNFRAWVLTQDYEGKQLDKDVLVAGNKVYSADTCVFVSREVNNYMADIGGRYKSDWLGARWVESKKYGNAWKAFVSDNGILHDLGSFSTPQEAHLAWAQYKLSKAELIAAKQDDERISRGLVAKYEGIVKKAEESLAA